MLTADPTDAMLLTDPFSPPSSPPAAAACRRLTTRAPITIATTSNSPTPAPTAGREELEEESDDAPDSDWFDTSVVCTKSLTYTVGIVSAGLCVDPADVTVVLTSSDVVLTSSCVVLTSSDGVLTSSDAVLTSTTEHKQNNSIQFHATK